MTPTAYATAALAARHNSRGADKLKELPPFVQTVQRGQFFDILCDFNSQMVMNIEEKKITTINTGQTNFIIIL